MSPARGSTIGAALQRLRRFDDAVAARELAPPAPTAAPVMAAPLPAPGPGFGGLRADSAGNVLTGDYSGRIH